MNDRHLISEQIDDAIGILGVTVALLAVLYLGWHLWRVL